MDKQTEEICKQGAKALTDIATIIFEDMGIHIEKDDEEEHSLSVEDKIMNFKLELLKQYKCVKINQPLIDEIHEKVKDFHKEIEDEYPFYEFEVDGSFIIVNFLKPVGDNLWIK